MSVNQLRLFSIRRAKYMLGTRSMSDLPQFLQKRRKVLEENIFETHARSMEALKHSKQFPFQKWRNPRSKVEASEQMKELKIEANVLTPLLEGKSVRNLNYLQKWSQTRVHFHNGFLRVSGRPDNVERAQSLIKDLLEAVVSIDIGSALEFIEGSLSDIKAKSGAVVWISEGLAHVYGSEEAVDRARKDIKSVLSGIEVVNIGHRVRFIEEFEPDFLSTVQRKYGCRLVVNDASQILLWGGQTNQARKEIMERSVKLMEIPLGVKIPFIMGPEDETIEHLISSAPKEFSGEEVSYHSAEGYLILGGSRKQQNHIKASIHELLKEIHTIKVPSDKILAPVELETIAKATRTQAVLSEDAKRIFVSGDPDCVDNADAMIHSKFASRIVIPLEERQSTILQNSQAHLRLIEEEFDVEIYEPEDSAPFQNKLIVFGDQKAIKKTTRRFKKLLDNITIIALGEAGRFQHRLDLDLIRETSKASVTLVGEEVILLGKTSERRSAKEMISEFQNSVDVIESGVMTAALLGPEGEFRKKLIEETNCWLHYDIPGGQIFVQGTAEQREKAKKFFYETLEKYDICEIVSHELQPTVGLNKSLLRALEAEFGISLSILRDKGVQISGGTAEIRNKIRARLEEFRSRISRVSVGNRLSFVMGSNFENLKNLQKQYNCSIQVDFGSNEILIGADAKPSAIRDIRLYIDTILQDIDEIDLGPDLPLIIGRGAENVIRIKKEAKINVHHMKHDILFLEGDKRGRALAKRMIADLQKQISVIPTPGMDLTSEQCAYISRLSKCLVASHIGEVHVVGAPTALKRAAYHIRDLQKKDDSIFPILNAPPKEGQWLLIPEGGSFQLFQFLHVAEDGFWVGHIADQTKRLRSRSGKMRMTAPVHINFKTESGMPIPNLDKIKANPRVFIEPFEMDQLESATNQPFRFYTKPETFLLLRKNQNFQKYHM